MLGSGGMALVLDALEMPAREPVAIKVLHRRCAPSAAVQERFAREVALARSLEHPALVAFYDAFEQDGHQFLVMERLQGTLQDWVAQNGPVPVGTALVALARVADGVAHAHAAGVVHRDLKPENLLIDAAGQLKVADFGIALCREEPSELTATGILLGTLAFMAPEQKGAPRDVGPAADLYALGAVLLWMLTGRLPFDAYVAARREAALAPLDPRLAALVERACQFQAAARFESAAAFADALRATAEALADGPTADGLLRPAVLARGPTVPLTETWMTPSFSGEASAPPARAGANRAERWRALPWILLTATLAVAAWRSSEPAEEGPADPVADRERVPPAEATSIPIRLEGLPACAETAIRFRVAERLGPRETLGVGAADLDADGVQDLVFVNQLSETLSVVWSAAIDDTPTAPAVIDEIDVGRALGNPATGDVNGDGVTDLVLARADASEIVVMLGSAERAPVLLEPQFQDGFVHTLHLLDWDGDGRLDLFFNHRNGVFLRRGLGDGRFSDPEGMLADPTLSIIGPAQEPNGQAPPTLWVRDDARVYAIEGTGTGGIATRTPVLDLEGPPLRLSALPRATGAAWLYAWEPWRGGRLARFVPSPDGLVGCIEGPMSGADDHKVVDINADGRPDLLGSRTCAGCESMQRLKIAY